MTSKRRPDGRPVMRAGSFLLAMGMGLAVLTGTGAAHAESTVLEVYPQAIQRDKQILPILTDAPAGTGLDVYVNKKLVDTVPLRTHSTGEDFIRYDRAWGLGTLQLRDGETSSGRVALFGAVKMTSSYRRVGNNQRRLRVKVRARRYAPAQNKWVRTAKPVLHRKQGTWKKVRNVKLDKAGRGKVVLRPKRAFRYRFVVKKTKHNQRVVQPTMGRI